MLYEEGASNCGNQREKLAALLESGLLWQWLAVQSVNSGSGALPNSFRENLQLRQAFLGALNDAVRPVWDASRELLVECADVSKEDALAARCRDAVRKIPTLSAEPKDVSQSERACKPIAAAAVESSTPCTFSGALFAELEFYGNKQSGAVLMVSDDRLPTNAAQIELATKVDGRAHIITTEPIQFDGWVRARKGVVGLRQRVELVSNHIWLPAGAPLNAYQMNGRVHASLAFGWGSGTRPQTWSGDVDCRDVTLVGPTRQQAGAGEPGFLAAGIVNLYDVPRGEVIGAIDGSGWARVWLQQMSSEWSHVMGSAPFVFDAWVRQKDISNEKPFGIGLLSPQCSRATRNPLPLRLRADLNASVIGVLPVGGELRVDAGLTSGEFIAIEVPGIRPANDQSRFFVSREFISAGTVPLG